MQPDELERDKELLSAPVFFKKSKWDKEVSFTIPLLLFAALFLFFLIVQQPDYLFRELIIARGTQTEGIITGGKYHSSKYSHENNVHVQFAAGQRIYDHDINEEDYDKIRENNPHEGNPSVWKLKSPIKVHIYYWPNHPDFFTIEEYSVFSHQFVSEIIVVLFFLGTAAFYLLFPKCMANNFNRSRK